MLGSERREIAVMADHALVDMVETHHDDARPAGNLVRNENDFTDDVELWRKPVPKKLDDGLP